MAENQRIDEALQRIEGAILPSVSILLDTLVDAAALAKPGADAETYAAEIRALTLQVKTLAREVQAAAPAPVLRRNASAA